MDRRPPTARQDLLTLVGGLTIVLIPIWMVAVLGGMTRTDALLALVAGVLLSFGVYAALWRRL